MVIPSPVPEPFIRIGVAYSLFVQCLQDLFQLLVAGAPAEIVGADFQRGIARGVALFQKILHCVLTHKVGLGLVHLPKARIHVDLAEIVPQKKGKETVHGRDLRIMKKRLLPLQVDVVGILFDLFCDRRADPLAHLGRRRFRERDHQETVDVHRVLSLADHSDDPLDKHCRLAAPGRRRDQNIMFSRLQNPGLLLGKLYCHNVILLILFGTYSRPPADRIRTRPCRDNSRTRSCHSKWPEPPSRRRPGSARPACRRPW